MGNKSVFWLMLLLVIIVLVYRQTSQRSIKTKSEKVNTPLDNASQFIIKVAMLTHSTTPPYKCDTNGKCQACINIKSTESPIQINFYGTAQSIDSLKISLAIANKANTTLALAHYFEAIEQVFFALKIYDTPNLTYKLVTRNALFVKISSYLISSTITIKERKVKLCRYV